LEQWEVLGIGFQEAEEVVVEGEELNLTEGVVHLVLEEGVELGTY